MAEIPSTMQPVDFDPFADATGAATLALTAPQREMHSAVQMGDEASCAYNQCFELRFRGPLSLQSMERALAQVVERHEALRLRITSDGDAQEILESIDVALPLADLSSMAEPERSAKIARLLEHETRTPFDLTVAPLWRAQLVREAVDSHRLIFTAHHLVCDGWSSAVMFGDLAGAYAADRFGMPAKLAPAASYREFIEACESPTIVEETQAAEEFWVQQYAAGVPSFELPLDHPRPRIKTYAAAREVLRVDEPTYAAVRKMGVQHNCTLFVTLLAAFEALIAQLSGSEEFVLGVPMASQALQENGHLVAHAVNTIPLRCRANMQHSFSEHLLAARKTFLGAQAHQRLTFGSLLQRLKLPRDPSRTPLVSVLFNIDKLGAPFDFGELALEGIEAPKSFANFEVSINAVDSGKDLLIECDYNCDLHDAATVRRWLALYRTALERVAADPALPLALALAPTPADTQLLAAFNRTEADWPRDTRIEALIAQQVAASPDRIAVTAGGRHLSYRELDARANALAAKLRALDVGPGSLVGLSCGRNEHMLVGLVGILKSGAGYIPLDPDFPADRLEFMAADSGLRHVVSDRSVSDSLKLRSAECLIVDDTGAQAECPTPLGSADDVAYVIYTSGSTGRPKGVVVPHRTVTNLLESVRKEPGMTAGQSVLSVTTLSFDIAVSEVILPLTVGARVVVADREQATDGDRLRALVEAERIDFIDATPSTWRLLLAAGWMGSPQITAICTGEPLPPELGRELLPLVGQLWNGYGPTETTVWSSFHRVELIDGPVPIGHPVANTAFHVVDAQLRPVPVGVVGELFIGGAGVTLGYLGRPDLTAERFLPDPFSTEPGARWYRTGDLGRWRADGVLECLGRSDHQVKVRGYRIELGEIEANLLTHPQVARAVVIVRADVPGDLRLVSYIVPRGGATLPPATELLDHLRAVLPQYMLPQYFVQIDSVPLLPNGKLDRLALPAPEAQVTAAAQRVAPRHDGERLVAVAMERVLQLSGLGIHDNFFALGGHSLLAAQLASSLSRTSGQKVPLRAVFDAPTIEQLAAWVARRDGAAGKAIEPIGARAEQSVAPASLMQQRVWFLEQMEPGRTTYNAPSAHRLKGALDVAALERAFNTLIQRQSILRTEIFDQAGVPMQRVVPELRISLAPIEDLSAVPADQREHVLAAALRARAAELLDLRCAPLFKLGLYRMASEEHVLFFMPHHMIWDGWSLDLFQEEMAALYGAYSQGLEPGPTALTVSYGDFAQWQEGWLRSDDLQQQLAHWKAKLADLPELLELPLDRPRPARMSGDGDNERMSFASDLVEDARRFGQAADATLFMMLLAGYAATLSRITGQTDLVIGTPVRGRHSADVEKVMGFFVNALPLRIRVLPEQPFGALLQHVREVVLDAFSHPDVPFEQLVRELDVLRDESHSPVYQTFFSFQDARQRVQTWGSLRQEHVHTFSPGSEVDLGLWFVENPHGMSGEIQYNSDVLTAASARSIRQQFELMLRAVISQPALPLAQVGLVSDDEQHTLGAWNGTTVELPHGQSVSGVIEARTALDPQRQALRSAGLSLTYGELDARANRLAHLLRSRGIGRGALVGLCVERSVDMIVAQLAIMKSGAAYVPLDPAYPVERLAYMAQDAQLALMVTHSSLSNTVAWPRSSAVLMDLDAALLAAQPGTRLTPDEARDARADDPAYVIYTSGTTGKPKGVVVPHRAVVNFLASMACEPGLGASDRLVAVTTLSFDIAVLELLLPLSVGAEVVLASRDDAMNGSALRALLDASDATVMQATPGTWHMLIDAGWQGSPTFKALVGGESLPRELAGQLLERSGQLWNMYGPTETTVWSTCCKIENSELGISIGRPIANTQVHVLDAHRKPCPIGVAGEIVIGGEGVALGYLNRPDLTADRFIDGGPSLISGQRRLYRTGDRGRWRRDGMLEHMGRLDSQVKVRGHRIELGEIEANLHTHPQVAQAVVIVREDSPGDQRLVSYVVPRGAMPSDGALREHLRAMLPQYMLPQHVVQIDAIPLLPNGKIDRRALPHPGEKPVDRVLTTAQPHTPAEAAIAGIWEELLGIDRVQVSDNFFDLGGHSLLAMRAVAKMEQHLGVRINVRRLIFESLGQLAATEAESSVDSGAQTLPKKGMLDRLMGSLRARARAE